MKNNCTSTKTMNLFKGIPAFKSIIKMVLVLAILTMPNFVKAQTPTLIGSTTVAASGSGVGGKPANITWNIPSGKNRMLIVSMYFERHHDGTGNNYPSTPLFDSSIPIKVGGLTFNVLNSYFTYYVTTGSFVAANANFSASMYVYRFRDVGGLPTGLTTFDFSAIKDPLYAGDDAIVNIAVFENVAQTGPPLMTSGYQMGSSAATNILTQTATAYTPVPIGRSANEILYLANSGLTQDKNIIVSSAWANIQNVIKSNSAGTSFTGGSPAPMNEPDGVASQMAYRFMSSGNPTVTYDRSATPANVSTHSIIGIMHALLPLAKPSITGTVYSDTDGPTNINGVVTNAGGLYVNVIDALGNLIYSATVNGSGVFNIPTGIVLEGDSYRLELSKNTGTIGTAAPLKALPVGWNTVGESSTGVSPYANDGTNDGAIVYTMAATNVTDLHYGIKFADADNDGISDPVDLDDDNDGILDTAECNSVEKVTNGFNVTPTTLTGWTVSGSPGGWQPSSGIAIESSNDAPGIYKIKQTINGLVAGKTYTITFDTFALGPANPNANTLSVTIDGTNYYSKAAGVGIGTTPQGESITFSTTTSSTSATIEFTSTITGTLGSAGKDVYVRRVSLAACELDTDGDGTPDYLDLDSDNDSCFDAIEGGENVIKTQLNANGSINSAVDANGVPVLVNSGGAADNGNNSVGQGIGTSINTSLKDPACYTLVLNPDSYSGITGIAFTTANILINDLLEAIVPVIGTAAGQVVISQSGTWPAGITLNTSTGAVSVANTVNGGVYVVNYQTCVNGTSPLLCQTQTITITLCGKFPISGTPDSYTKTGVSTLVGFANGWPGNVPNGFIAVESKNKGFVITRVSSSSAIATPVEGMLIYDIAAACIKLYNGTTWNCLQKNCN